MFPSGEIYGGTRSAWDYGPLGVELKDNIKRQWWRAMVTAATTSSASTPRSSCPAQVWVASGHVEAFVDPLVECQSCHKRFRADHLQEEFAERKGSPIPTACGSTRSPARTAAPAASGPSRGCSTDC